MEDIMKIVRGRRSVRTFDGREIDTDDTNKLSSFIKKIENPYGIPIEFRFLDGKKQNLPCPVVSGTDLYVGAKAPRVPLNRTPSRGQRKNIKIFHSAAGKPRCGNRRFG